MKPFFILAIFVFFFFFTLSEASAAHYIVGQVNQSVTGISANGHTIMLWNPAFGTSDNQTDIIGPTGNSNQNNTYMIDCELLSHGCNVTNVLYLQVVNNGDNYVSGNVSVTVTGAGFDLAPTLVLNDPVNITSINATTPINLNANSTKQILCQAIASDPEGGFVVNATAQFFHSTSFYNDTDDNNDHYTNSSCSVNSSYGPGQSQINCAFNLWYYANAGSWNCTILAEDGLGAWRNASNSTTINPLLSVGINSPMDFGISNSNSVSNELALDVINFGNINVNLSLYGYAYLLGDGNSMNCTNGTLRNISIGDEKYNLSASTPGSLSYTQFSSTYTNLSNDYTVRNFPMPPRTNDLVNNAINTTYWRIFVPSGIDGNCTGNIVFGASTSPGT